MAQLLRGGRLLLDERIVDGHDLLIADGRIVAVGPGLDPDGATPVDLPPGSLLAPGFIDVQVNGGGGTLFNDEPTQTGVQTIAAAHRRFGTTGLLPTIITDAPDRLSRAADAVIAARAIPGSGVLGVHFEGPFISPQRPGVHDPRFIRSPTAADLALLTDLAADPAVGRVLLTLAPETVDSATLDRLAGTGILLSAGHSAADWQQTTDALAHGVRGFTHLFNAMPPLTARAPGLIAAALLDPNSWCGLIVDGIHVHPGTLRLALAAKPFDRMMLVTDAMLATGTDVSEFDLQGRRVLRRNGRLETEDGTLAGADIDMAQAVRNCRDLLGLPVERALALASRHPAAFLGLDDRLGRIAPGWQADLVLLTDDLQVLGTWVEGGWLAADPAKAPVPPAA
ncbi:N-acetylglucosamine-6-phosphate deacetylase [Azospirillum griseum]|uniref:N-acetylglucosamine-6-phosphate deacetylase n=1 Tax=Azospirillum griseum TaxID=2496639 RepID=A0A431VKC1_9PROT|nr:N-acetylglucosamine-6-phosphate deacetylase [Azospirillum griseum]RTR22070.1 N-acetylglucosamine-6-phosphate deacetylase [Azospirillum griseum]